MNTGKKRIVVVLLIIISGIFGAYLFLRNKNLFKNYSYTNLQVPTVTGESEKTNLLFDFESELTSVECDNINEVIAHSGKRSCELKEGKEYGPTIKKIIREIGTILPKKISMSVWIYPLTDNPNTVLTASIVNSNNSTIFWEGKSTENKFFKKNKWTKINASYFLPTEKFTLEDEIIVGVWNKDKTAIIIDDLEIVYGESIERRGAPSTMDVNAIYEKRFVGEKNKPPYRTIYFEKQEINNGNSTSITPPNEQNSIDYFSPNDQFIVGDFLSDKNNLDEVLCIKESGQNLFTFNSEKQQFVKLWENTNKADSIWNSDNQYYKGDFNSDGKIDMLLVNKKNNNWRIINFNQKKWEVTSKGTNPKKEWTSEKAIVKNGNTSANDFLYPGYYFDNIQTFLNLNTDWRFDLKLLVKENERFTILGNVDFKGYPNDYNPKYFEFVKIIPGYFLQKNQTSLLIVMCNCKDKDFSGQNCKQIDNLSFLPNSTQLYSLPQITQINTDKR